MWSAVITGVTAIGVVIIYFRSFKEIAGSLALDVGTVKAHMARAVAKLRKELRDLYIGPAPGAGRGEVGT